MCATKDLVERIFSYGNTRYCYSLETCILVFTRVWWCILYISCWHWHLYDNL